MPEIGTLGDTGLVASRIGLGLAALGRPGYINLGRDRDLGAERSPAALRARCHAVLDSAWDAGVNYFDVARSYGRAEEFLAEWFAGRGLAPGAATVGSKWGYRYTAGWAVRAEVHEIKEHSAELLRRQWSESRKVLGEHLTLYQIHSATEESGVLDDAEVITELMRLRERTRVRIGLTTSGPRQSETILRASELAVAGQRVFDVVQATWNLLEPSAGEALAAASETGLGVIVKEVLANGRLAGRHSEGQTAGPHGALAREARRLSTTPDALAIAAAIQQPWAHVVLSGAATVDQMESNLAAVRIRMDEEAISRLARLRESPVEYWSRRGELAWN